MEPMPPEPALQPPGSVRERILAAARHIFLDGPPEQATMDAVAQRAGMSKKTIYREFKSQFELLAALLAEYAADLSGAPPPAPGADIELELYGLLTRILKHATSSRTTALARLILTEIRRYPELVQQTTGKRYPIELLAGWLASPAVRERYDIGDPYEAASMLVGMVLQDAAFKALILPNAPPMPAHLIEDRARRAVAIFLRGVRK
jgi:TetR/AcrR family transcriptional regulator, mexJK operon transcriptional repressor